jgi:DNA invertase Pin-like site-specific DNA recombinase
LLAGANRRRFDVVVVWSCDRLARSTRHFLQVLDELNGLNIQFLSQRESIDTSGVLGRAILTIIAAVAELERSLIVERVKSGMRRAKLEGRQIGRTRLDINREQVVRYRRSGMSLTTVARKHGISRASVCRLMKDGQGQHGNFALPDCATTASALNLHAE